MRTQRRPKTKNVAVLSELSILSKYSDKPCPIKAQNILEIQKKIVTCGTLFKIELDCNMLILSSLIRSGLKPLP